MRVTPKGLALRGYEYVPGIVVTGLVPNGGTAVLRVAGRAASRGSVRVSPTLAVTGRLGGKRVTARFGAGAARATGPYGGLTLAQAVARGKRLRAMAG